MRKYDLATSIHWKYDSTCKTPIADGIARIVRAGFTNLDFAFLNMCMNPEHDFLGEDYLAWVRDVRRFTDSIGAKFVQAHAPCESIRRKDYDYLVELDHRAIECCAELGIPWIVFHTICGRSPDGDDFAFNLRHFRSMVDFAEQYGVGIALENVFPIFSGYTVSEQSDVLIKLVDELNSEYAGICWDFGHAHIAQLAEGGAEIAKQSVQLKKLGERLKCTHVHDNRAKSVANGILKDRPLPSNGRGVFALDSHVAPYAGDIDWDDVIAGLDAIDYAHYFTYEAHNAVNPLPEELADDAMRMMYKLGTALLSKSRL